MTVRTYKMILVMIILFPLSSILPIYAEDLNSQYENFCIKRPEQRKVWLQDENTLCMNGAVDDDMLKQFLAIELREGSQVLLVSTGGAVDVGKFIGGRLFEANVRTIAQGPCFSACATYLFMSGKEKVILNNGYVGFHGGPWTPKKIEEEAANDRDKRFLEAVYDDNVTFFKMIGANPDIEKRLPDNSDQILFCPHEQACVWTWRKEEFESFGINILYMPENYPAGWREKIVYEPQN